MNGLSIDILRNGSDCTSNGVTSPIKAKGKVFVVFGEGISGPWQLDECQEKKDDFVCLKVVRRNLGGREYMHLTPMAEPGSRHVGASMGGNFGYSSDSRFGKLSDYPLPIHDRFETPEQYKGLSR